MSKKDKKTEEKLELIRAHRREQFEKLLQGKSNIEEFANSCFMFLIQNKVKPTPKAHDKSSIILNYYYWLIQIERKVAIERQLIKLQVGSWEHFQRLSEVYVKRRDQMVRRLVWELNLKPEDAYLVFDDTIEVIMDSEVFYSTKESLDKVKLRIDKIKKSALPFYMPILNLRYEP